MDPSITTSNEYSSQMFHDSLCFLGLSTALLFETQLWFNSKPKTNKNDSWGGYELEKAW